MQLQPKRPPGRVDRKAGAYAAEIVRLRREGYTYVAIREALATVGVEVSECAVRREVRRHERQIGRAIEHVPAKPPAAEQPVRPAVVPSRFNLDRRSGKEIAEEFFANHPPSPFIRSKDRS